ncbi:MAG: zf-HC2 domain-containing protein [Dehalococcoidia bacterium]|nr:zf-HC2 domain-containing protein [Dehalococcoidia bacterium]
MRKQAPFLGKSTPGRVCKAIMGLMGRLTALFKRGSECRDIRMAASAYVDGDLQMTQAEWVRAHLSGCVACQAFVDTLVETVRLLGTMKREQPAPAGLTDTIRVRIAEEGRLGA